MYLEPFHFQCPDIHTKWGPGFKGFISFFGFGGAVLGEETIQPTTISSIKASMSKPADILIGPPLNIIFNNKHLESLFL